MSTRFSRPNTRRSWGLASLGRLACQLARRFNHGSPARRAAARVRFLRAEPLEERALLSFSGLKSIGPTGDFLSITNAISAIRTDGLGGPLTLELQAAYQSSAEPAGSPITFSILP